MNNKQNVWNLKIKEALYMVRLIIKSLVSPVSVFISLYFWDLKNVSVEDQSMFMYLLKYVFYWILFVAESR
jgi:hypothetical protein